MSDRHPTPGAAGPPVGPTPTAPDPRPTLDSLLPHLRPELRPALLPSPLPPRSPAAPPADPFDRAADPARLPAFDPADLPDPAADPVAAHGVAAAVGCPDLFLVAAPPGPARDRFLRAVADAAARRGERVLVLAPTPAAADRLATLLHAADRPAVRALAPGERPDYLPGDLADRTSHAHGAGLVAAAARALADAVRDAEDRAARAAAVAPVWERLRGMAAADDAGREAELRLLADAHAAETAAIDVGAAAADAERAARQTELVALREQLKQATTLAEAKRGSRVLSGMFWRAVFAGDVAGHRADLERRVRDAEAVLRELDARADRRDADRAAAAVRHAADRAGVVARRTARTDAPGEFRAACDELTAAGVAPPASATASAVADAEAEARRRAGDGPALARRCLADLTADPDAAARRFLARASLVVAPPEAVATDPAVAAARFDRLIVDSAESLSEPGFRAAARTADRWLLSGWPGEGDYHYMNGNTQTRRPAARHPGGVFALLWDRLHRPTWAAEGDRLVCRLADAGHALHCEPCADRPDVELRFGTGPGGEPVVAEIAFPRGGPEAAADAKAFLARELGEVRLTPCGPARWVEAGGRLAVEWPLPADAGCCAAVGPGVCEYVAVVGGLPVTTRVTFDPAAGWDRVSAGRWVEQHTAAARTARTARLPAPERVAEPAEPCLV